MEISDKRFEEILKTHNGAKFHWADLHIHTPAWKGFSLPSEASRSNQDEIARLYIEKAIKENIDILGITEHNDVRWIDPIHKAAEGTGVAVFPGFEITTDSGKDGIHLTCLFDPGTNSNVLDHLLSNIGLTPSERFNTDGTPRAFNKGVNEVIEIIKDRGGICIAPHILNEKGLLKESEGQIRMDIFKNDDLFAVEIPSGRADLTGFNKEVLIENKRDNYKRKRLIACLNSSDAKSVDDIGRKKTCIKLAVFSVEGLREAFIDWESRIRLESDLPSKSPIFSKIIGVYWQGGFLDGMAIHFNDNLNCIIGGKGTGKSTIVETLRYIFDEKPKTEKCAEQYKDILREVFRSGSKISILVESHEPTPKQYIIERNYPDSPVVKEINGSIRSDLKPRDIIGAEIYGQKEIYEISRNAAFQMELLNRFIGKNTDALADKEKDLLKKLEDNKNDLLRFQRTVTSAEDKISNLPSIEEKIKRYKELGIQDRLKEKRFYTKEEHILQQGLEKVRRLEGLLEGFIGEIDLDTVFLKQSDDLPNKTILGKAESIIKNLREQVDKSVATLSVTVRGARQSYEDDVMKTWGELNKKQNETYSQILRDLQKEFESVDPNELIQLEQNVEQLKLIKNERDKYKEELKRLMDVREKTIVMLSNNRVEQFQIRDRIVRELNDKLKGSIEITLEYQGERDRFVEKLKQLRSKAKEEQLVRVVEAEGFSPVEFAKSVRQGPDKLADQFGISPSTAQLLCKAISIEELFDIEITRIPTKAVIKLNLGTDEFPKYREINNLSVGQKCTALLTLILLDNPYPLIIDQPEDDLDNAFIVNDIVKKLRKEKEKRQFVIATHNANIPVLGDAELIAAITADYSHASIKEGDFGSIDETSVKEVVKNTLEGGRQAFDMRREKYGI
jgi:predicted metal-dependent phosphoesterase TrpH/energy-coupling factor transporter ATP-binding protein EcfA2